VFYKRINIELPSSYTVFDIRSLMLVETSCENWDHVSSLLVKEHSHVIRRNWDHASRKRSRFEVEAEETVPWHGGASAAAASAAAPASPPSEWLDMGAVRTEIDRLSTELPIDREAVKALHRLAAADVEDF